MNVTKDKLTVLHLEGTKIFGNTEGYGLVGVDTNDLNQWYVVNEKFSVDQYVLDEKYKLRSPMSMDYLNELLNQTKYSNERDI